jgi:hypothetical protein
VENDDLSLTYEDLDGGGRPAGWTVQKHADHAHNGMVVVFAPPAIAGLGLLPGQQVNYQRDDDGNVTAYSIGPVEGAEPTDKGAGEATPTSATPQPQASSTGLTPEPQASSTDSEVTLQDQSNTDPTAKGATDIAQGWPKEGDNGWWELSDGRKVRGENAAIEAQVELDEAGS